jgi:hypothetical protein
MSGIEFDIPVWSLRDRSVTAGEVSVDTRAMLDALGQAS